VETALEAHIPVFAFLVDESRPWSEKREQDRLHRCANNRHGEAMTLGTLGKWWLDGGQPREALEHLGEARKAFERIGDQPARGKTLWREALAFEMLGDRAKARALAEEARAVLEGAEDSESRALLEEIAKMLA
jgi:tetratricopeptide (TPR) repeat protein